MNFHSYMCTYVYNIYILCTHRSGQTQELRPIQFHKLNKPVSLARRSGNKDYPQALQTYFKPILTLYRSECQQVRARHSVAFLLPPGTFFPDPHVFSGSFGPMFLLDDTERELGLKRRVRVNLVRTHGLGLGAWDRRREGKCWPLQALAS